MFAISERVRPWRLRWNPSSLGRSTRIVPSSWTIFISVCTRWLRLPRGPFTVTTASSPTVTSTPLGISIGCLPIRLIFSQASSLLLAFFGSPDVREDLAADPPAGGVPVGHHTMGRGHDRDPQPAEHARELVPADVDPPTRRADPLEPGDRPLALGPVLEVHAEDALDALALGGEPGDEPLGREDLQHGLVHLRERHEEVVLVREVRVADPREQVRDRIADVG